jgi:hypothetical protein
MVGLTFESYRCGDHIDDHIIVVIDNFLLLVAAACDGQ